MGIVELRAWGSVVAVAVLLAACSAESPEVASSGSSSRPRRAPTPRCGNRQLMLSGEARRRPGRLVAQLDDRPGRERAWIAVGPSPREDCRAWLLVEGSFGRAGVPIAGTDAFARASLGLPVLSGTASIDGHPGAEILVDVTAGASTTFVAVFSLVGGDVVKVDVVGTGAPPDDLFSFGGSVGHVHAVDCAGRARVVVSRAQAGARRYAVARRYFAAEGPVWRAQPDRNERGAAWPRQLGRRWPEFSSSPFLSCSP
jgi:hypothetical protein